MALATLTRRRRPFGLLHRLGAALAIATSLAVLVLVNAGPAAAFDGFDQKASFSSVNFPGQYMRHRQFLGALTPLYNDLDGRDATFTMRRGLSGAPGSVSFESVNYPGHYLRHQGFRLKLAWNDRTYGFGQDATFMPRAPQAGALRFEAVNFSGYYIRHANFDLWLAKDDGSYLFTKDSTWQRKTPIGTQVGRGECTDWALDRRPDLASTVSGNAQEWTARARNARRPVSKFPSQGSVMVLQGGVMGAGATTGHVAYVESVQRDAYGNPTSFVISEQNWNGKRYSTLRTIQVSSLPPTGVDFIG